MVRLTRTSIEFRIFGTWIRYDGRTSSWPVFLHDTILGALGYFKLCLTVKHYFRRQGKKLSNERLRELVEGLLIEHQRREALKGETPQSTTRRATRFRSADAFCRSHRVKPPMTSANDAIQPSAEVGPHPEEQYLDLLRKLLAEGVYRPDRTGTGTYSIFGHQMRFDLAKGFPLITTKRIFFKGSVHEMLWFLSGSTNIRYLQENGVRIWDEWADENGNLGPVYGKQWRAWETKDGRTIDQIADLVENIRKNPYSRRHLITSWNPGELSEMALPPCAMNHMVYCDGGRLSGLIFQRSVDSLLGLPWNISAGSLLIHMLAKQCDLEPGELVWQGADVHLYRNHRAQAELQIKREPRPFPKLNVLRRPPSIFDYKYEDFELVGYDPHPHIPAPIAV